MGKSNNSWKTLACSGIYKQFWFLQNTEQRTAEEGSGARDEIIWSYKKKTCEVLNTSC